MAISIISNPPDYAFANDEINVEFQSTLFTLGRSTLKLTFSDYVNADEAITIDWDGNSVTMTAAASPDNSGNQFPASGATLADFVDAVENAFLQNETLLQNVTTVRSLVGSD